MSQAKIATVKNAQDLLPEQTETQLRYVDLFKHGTLTALLYSPIKVDNQTPHEQDEVYVIISGSGKFVCDGEVHQFGEGDIIFVPANAPHRFIDFTDDFQTWGIFYGPINGEAD